MYIIKGLYLRNFLFVLIGANVVLFIISFFFSAFLFPAKIFLILIVLLLFMDVFVLFRIREAMSGTRECADRLSNGDENDILIYLKNYYPFKISISVIDELPVQLQIREFNLPLTMETGEEKILKYKIRPVKRGEYEFGSVNVYVSGVIGLIRRKFKFSYNQTVKVYPSYLQMRKYELLAINNNLVNSGIKKIRRIGNTMEFEKIKEYVQGDDVRTINWKATARKNSFMVNLFQEEKSQQMYCVIDKGRVMKMPFEGMSLLDYAINASLVISNIAIKKEDKAGLITFSNAVSTTVPASKKNIQMSLILDALYNEKTGYKESDYQKLYIYIKRKISQRSLIILFSNFETLNSLKRQLKYLKYISQNHLLVIVFFENTEIGKILDKEAVTTEEIYIKAIAEKFVFEKKQIVKELKTNGIHSIFSTPKNLTVKTINKYLELKARNQI